LSFRSAELENGTGFYASGNAVPGTSVRLYLNGSHLADVVADDKGEWSITVRRGLTGGHYAIRADAIGPSGKVVARAEVPFDVPVEMAAAPAAAAPQAPSAAPDPPSAPNPADVAGLPAAPAPPESAANPPVASSAPPVDAPEPPSAPNPSEVAGVPSPVGAPVVLARQEEGVAVPAVHSSQPSAAGLAPAARVSAERVGGAPGAADQPEADRPVVTATPSARPPMPPQSPPQMREASRGETPTEVPLPRPDLAAAVRAKPGGPTSPVKVATPVKPAGSPAIDVPAAPASTKPAAPSVQTAAAAPTADDNGPATPTSHAVIDQIETALVVRGDNLWNISRTRLGHGRRYTEVYAANLSQIRDPNLIYPGQVFVVPQR
jgi:nucleoid-associated protein YgaU